MSPNEAGEGPWVVVGRVLSPWGTAGAVKADVATVHPERFEPGRTLRAGGSTFTIESSRIRGSRVFLKFHSIDSPETADGLRGLLLEAPASEAPPPSEATYYHHQIIGLRVRTTDGRDLGVVEAIITMGSNDVYVVRTDYGEELIPAIEDVIVSVDVDGGQILIEPVEGLLSGPGQG